MTEILSTCWSKHVYLKLFVALLLIRICLVFLRTLFRTFYVIFFTVSHQPFLTSPTPFSHFLFSHTLHLSNPFPTTAASDITGSTCIHRVAFLGLTEVGKLLLAGGCPIDAVNVEGDAATHIAAREVRTCKQYVLYSACWTGWWIEWSLYQW